MGKKIFVSYKYSDGRVKSLPSYIGTTVRDYVTEFEKTVDSSDDIFKGESDDEDMSSLSEDTIWDKLRNRIYDSSVTVVFISPGMKENMTIEKDQWIPWEVSYSLKETSRKNKNGDPVTSKSNAMVAVVLPDENESYSYYLERKNCCDGGCITHHTGILFEIIKNNMFNLIDARKKKCDTGSTIWRGEHSYIKAVKWSDFIIDYSAYIDDACKRQDNINNYKLSKDI